MWLVLSSRFFFFSMYSLRIHFTFQSRCTSYHISWIVITFRSHYQKYTDPDTIGNCQRPVFSLSVSQHMHKITILWKFELNWSSKLRDNNERKKHIVTRSCVLSDAWFRDLKFYIWGLEIKFVENYFFLENYISLERAVSHNVLYYQPLPITRYQVRFYANNYFESLPIVYTAFKETNGKKYGSRHPRNVYDYSWPENHTKIIVSDEIINTHNNKIK